MNLSKFLVVNFRTRNFNILDLDDGWSLFYEDAAPKAVIFIEESTLTMSQFDPPLYHLKQNVTTQPLWSKEDQKSGKSEVIEEKMECPQHSAQYMEDYCVKCQKIICPSNLKRYFSTNFRMFHA